MPLPAISFAQPQQTSRSDSDVGSDDSDDGVDGILAMLRSSNHSEKTPSTDVDSKTYSSSLRAKTPDSEANDAAAANDVSERRVKFDPAFSKGSSDLDGKRIRSAIPDTSKLHQAKTIMPRHSAQKKVEPQQELGSTSRTTSPRSVARKPRRDYNSAELSDNDSSLQQYQTKATLNQQQPHDSPTSESYKDMLDRIASSQKNIQEICYGIKELQTARDDTASESVKSLIQGVAKSQDQLGELTEHLSAMMEELKTRGLQETDERKELAEKINVDRSKLDARWDALEKDKAELERERNVVFAEKEKLLKDRLQFQKDEALFEQRKLASKDDLKYAESRIDLMQQMEAKLTCEMNKLYDLSEFVSKKDADANQKLAEATSLYEKAQELESLQMSDAEVIERQKQLLERERTSLVQERVAVLKERSVNRDLRMSDPVQSSSSSGHRLSSSLTVDSSDAVFKQRLSAIKGQLNRLKY